MKALVYHGPGIKSWDEVPDPALIDATDAIVRVDTTTICGTDLHILKGDVPAVTEGRILGHEGVGTVLEVGSSVRNVAVGDRVIISCISSCGVCTYCRSGNPSHCLADEGASGIGWILGHLIDGTQAEMVRIPFADNSLYPLPDLVPDDAAVLLSDIFLDRPRSAWQAGRVGPGDTVAVVGAGPSAYPHPRAGPTGAAQIVAIDLDESRLDSGLKQVGASHCINSASRLEGAGVRADRRLRRRRRSRGRGVPATFDMCTQLVRPGGNVANVGVHGKPVTLDLRRCGSRTSTSAWAW